MWKYEEKNIYPKIILHDCFVSDIQTDKYFIDFNFAEEGFWIEDKEKKDLFRTSGSCLTMEIYDKSGVDNYGIEEYVSIKMIKIHRIWHTIIAETIHEISFKEFVDNINSHKWRFEFTDEFYSTLNAYYIGILYMKNKYYECHIKINCKDLIYKWNDVRYDCPW